MYCERDREINFSFIGCGKGGGNIISKCYDMLKNWISRVIKKYNKELEEKKSNDQTMLEDFV